MLKHDRFRFILRILLRGLLLAASLQLVTCKPVPDRRAQIQELGLIRVAILNSPTTYFTDASGEMGFEYDLAKHFAEALGVELELMLADGVAEVIDWVQRGRAHLGAAGLAITPQRERLVKFSQPLRTVVPQLVYRMGTGKPSNLGDLNGRLRVSLDSSHPELLFVLQGEHRDLEWEEAEEASPEELLRQVAEGELDYTVANSDLVSINQRYYPQLRVAFDLSQEQKLGWVFSLDDHELHSDAELFLQAIRDFELARLRDRYFGHISRVGYVGAVTLASHVQSRLPKYQQLFEEAAAAEGIDWRLLAAIGYQESHWNPKAVSPTGVRGLMQITRNTASFLGISNRLDPAESIAGAARYIRSLSNRLPSEVQEPDRTWMALAAYNIGLGHLRDARGLTQEHGRDPNRWVDVRAHLPLLTQPKWYKATQYGYARGHEAVTYVGNIRTYYDMLVWMTGGNSEDAPIQAQPENQPRPESELERDPLAIDSPVL